MDYPQIEAKVYMNQVATFKTVAYSIGNLVVGWTDSRLQSVSVYNAYGYRVSDVSFRTWEDAEQFAKFLIQHYENYFLLWEDNKQADVPGLTRYTIEDGLKIYGVLEELEGKVVTFKDVNECLALT